MCRLQDFNPANDTAVEPAKKISPLTGPCGSLVASNGHFHYDTVDSMAIGERSDDMTMTHTTDEKLFDNNCGVPRKYCIC